MKEPWPEGFRIKIGSAYEQKQTDWLFVVTSADCSNNEIGLTCEAEGSGTLEWRGTAQQLEREFRKVAV